jgi:hypothetical protein
MRKEHVGPGGEVMTGKLAFRESIADLWGYPDGPVRRPSTAMLIEAVSGEALACLKSTDLEDRIRRIENILSIIKWRMQAHWVDSTGLKALRVVIE